VVANTTDQPGSARISIRSNRPPANNQNRGSDVRTVHDHAVFIYSLEGVRVPSPGVRDGTIDDGVSRRMIDAVFAHRVTADRARPEIGCSALFCTARGIPALNHAMKIRQIGQKNTELMRTEFVNAPCGASPRRIRIPAGPRGHE
jgi:hypothetical protein